ncbi:hypothetical protein CPB85DRAFT_737374 [Mucidula mucida]|nr:hypothetical protein CPB85DRAFT_737374 [Mucidula mucida]
MGVAGLWPVLEDCAKTRSLTALALEAFDNEHKCFRLGIDASIWFFHAEYGKEGENPELRTLFFRCAQLLRAPIIPLFIFDGPKRPEFKRGKHINRQANKLTTGMKRIIESYGFQHRTAPGEAEAELAYLNSIGVIDGVLTDDVDTYLFGAHTIVRNPSSTHAKAKADAKKSFVRVYRDIPFTRADLILVGLCAGGDYNQAGLPNCGIKTAVGLAKSGLSESLYDAALNKPRHELPAFLNTWREAVVKELATNASGLIGRKMGALSRKVPKEFPDIDVLLSYINPITSLSEGFPDYYREINRDWLKKEPSLPALASTCEFFFEWGFRDSIVKRSRTFLWPGIAFRVLRRYILDGLCDGVPVQFGQCTGIEGQKSFMREIHSSRTHASTDGTLEYRVEIDPSVFVKLVESGIQGTRRADDHEWMDDDSEDEEAKNEDPNAPLRVWLPAALVRRACPEMQRLTTICCEGGKKKSARKEPGRRRWPLKCLVVMRSQQIRGHLQPRARAKQRGRSLLRTLTALRSLSLRLIAQVKTCEHSSKSRKLLLRRARKQFHSRRRPPLPGHHPRYSPRPLSVQIYRLLRHQQHMYRRPFPSHLRPHHRSLFPCWIPLPMQKKLRRRPHVHLVAPLCHIPALCHHSIVTMITYLPIPTRKSRSSPPRHHLPRRPPRRIGGLFLLTRKTAQTSHLVAPGLILPRALERSGEIPVL